MKIWHVSSVTTLAVIAFIFITAAAGSAAISALLFLLAYPAALVWFGWTLKERSMYKTQQTEQRVLDRLRKQGKANV